MRLDHSQAVQQAGAEKSAIAKPNFSPEQRRRSEHALHAYINGSPDFTSGAVGPAHASKVAELIGLPASEKYSFQDLQMSGGWNFMSPLGFGGKREVNFRLCATKPDGSVGRSIVSVSSGADTSIKVVPPNFGQEPS